MEQDALGGEAHLTASPAKAKEKTLIFMEVYPR